MNKWHTEGQNSSPYQLGKIKNKYLIMEIFAYSATSAINISKISRRFFFLAVSNFKLIYNPIETLVVKVSQRMFDNVVLGAQKGKMGNEVGMYY